MEIIFLQLIKILIIICSLITHSLNKNVIKQLNFLTCIKSEKKKLLPNLLSNSDIVVLLYSYILFILVLCVNKFIIILIVF